MKSFYHILISAFALAGVAACAPESDNEMVCKYTCNFEGEYWDSLVDPSPNGDNLINGTIPTAWHDEKSDLAGEVSQPYPGYWEGVALSNHCSQDCQNDGKPTDQLYAYVEKAYSGKNFIICNAFMNSPFIYFPNKRSYIESMQIALTTYSYNTALNGNHIARPLATDVSIWIEAVGYTTTDGAEQAVSTAKFYLYEKGEPAFEGWKKWYLTSMTKSDKVVFNIKWDGKEEYNPYPAYFAIDDIVVVRQEKQEL
jgi:hypothetical protein